MPRPVLYIYLLFSLAFIVIGIRIIESGNNNALGLATTLFFGACTTLVAMKLWPRLLPRQAPSLESLLSGYPGPLLLKSAPTIRYPLLAVISLGLSCGLLWLLVNGLDWFLSPGLPHTGGTVALSPHNNASEPIVKQTLLWLSVVLFLGSTPLLLILAVANGSAKGPSLLLSRDDFEIISFLGKRTTIRWQDASEFTVKVAVSLHVWNKKIVVFNTVESADSYLTPVNITNTPIAYNSSLTDSYGLATLDDLAALLNAWRAQALQTAQPTGKKPGQINCDALL